MNKDQQRVQLLSVESSSVQSHLQMMQNIIHRTGMNSAFCKTWCVTIVSAMLVLSTDNDRLCFVLLALVPTILFYIVDARHVADKEELTQSRDDFVCKLHKNRLSTTELYLFQPIKKSRMDEIKTLISWNVLPFYLVLGVLVLVVCAVFLLSPAS